MFDHVCGYDGQRPFAHLHTPLPAVAGRFLRVARRLFVINANFLYARDILSVFIKAHDKVLVNTRPQVSSVVSVVGDSPRSRWAEGKENLRQENNRVSSDTCVHCSHRNIWRRSQFQRLRLAPV